MFIREFRIPLPLTVSEFAVGQLYACAFQSLAAPPASCAEPLALPGASHCHAGIGSAPPWWRQQRCAGAPPWDCALSIVQKRRSFSVCDRNGICPRQEGCTTLVTEPFENELGVGTYTHTVYQVLTVPAHVCTH